MEKRVGIVLVIQNNDKFLLVKHLNENLWGMVSGGRERGETPKENVVREAREEVGLIVDPDKLIDLRYTITFVSTKGPGEQKAFLYKTKKFDIKVQESEIQKAVWFTFDEAIDLLTPKLPLIEILKRTVKKAD